MLAVELANCIDIVKSILVPIDLYNEYLGGTATLLASLLQRNLEEDTEWKNSSKWMDDCLISKFLIDKNNVQLGGLMIWGAGGTTQQWADPFSFECALSPNKKGLNKYIFYFGDENEPRKTYNDYRRKSDVWSDFNGNWTYIINEE
jgi:hypothetical protein